MTLPLTSATAQGPPATFHGTVTVDGDNVSDGTAVVALIDGKVCGEGARDPDGPKGTWTASETTQDYERGDSLYVIEVVSDSQIPGCGTEGARVAFLIGGKPAHEEGIWIAGPNRLNLTAGTSPNGGEPPTTPAGTGTPGGATSDQEASEDNGFKWWHAAAGGVGLAAVAIAAGLWQVKRTAKRKQA
jgi:hypothetical protein